MEDQKLTTPPFEVVSSPFTDDAPVVKRWITDLTGEQRQLAEEFFSSLGSSTGPILQSMTPDKIRFLQAIFEERQKASLAIARWNWIAKSIKYSFLSLSLSMATATLLYWGVLNGTSLNPFPLLKGYVGRGWVEASHLACFVGAMHNVYDSITLQRGVKKVREFSEKWVRKIFRKVKSAKPKNV